MFCSWNELEFVLELTSVNIWQFGDSWGHSILLFVVNTAFNGGGGRFFEDGGDYAFGYCWGGRGDVGFLGKGNRFL